MELGAEEAEEGRQQQEEPPVQKVKHSLLSKACRQLRCVDDSGPPQQGGAFNRTSLHAGALVLQCFYRWQRCL